MERDTLEVIHGARLDALPAFIGMALDEGASQPAEFLRIAAALQTSEPARGFAILTGLARSAAAPTERLIDALLEAGLRSAEGVDMGAAMAEIDAALARAASDESALRERVVARLIAAEALALVVDFANRSTGRVASPRFWYLALRSAETLGDEIATLTAAEALSKTRIEDPAHLLNAGVILLRFGRAQEVVDLIAANAAASAHPQVTRLKLDAELRLGRSDEISLASLRAVAAANPTDVRIANLEAQLLLNLDRPAEAVTVYARLPQERMNHTMRLRYAKAQELAGDLDDAINTYRAVLDEAPGNKALRRKLVGLCVRAGRSEEAQRVYRTGLSDWANTLSPTLAENLAEIMSSDCSEAIPAPRALWFEAALTAAGHAPPPDWRQRAGKMARIDQLIVQFAQTYPDGMDQLRSLVEVTPSARENLEAGLTMGKGAFVASAHVGLLYAGPIVLNKYGGPFAYVASVPDLGQPGVSNGLISTSTNELSVVGRRILRALRGNATVAIAIDGAGITSEETRPFFGKTIRLSDFAPRLAWRTGTPSYFPRITMDGAVAQFRLNALPMPDKDESEEAYAARWLDAYAEELAAFLCEHPEAMRGTGGFWSRIIEA
ncbi:MAG: tetratricopeptide repeat protein [Rhodobacteraceae bacterium]|nr:tetratricopeptide repeat protein [Paracoccaceae bacterium]